MIALAVSDGFELDAIEEQIINRAPLDEEDKSALWLYAEALTQRPARRPLAGAIFGEPRRRSPARSLASPGDWSAHD